MLTCQKPIVVVGSVNLDFVTTADHIPVAGETIHGNQFQIHPGGKGANQAVAVARLGYPVEMIGKIGSDLPSEQLRTHLQTAGVGLAGVEQIEGASGTAVILVARNGENCIVVTPGANAHVSPAYVDRHVNLIRKAGLVLTQLEIPIETIEYLAEVCFRENVPLMLDPAPAQNLPSGLLKRVSWFTPNETEAAFYAGGDPGCGPETAPDVTARWLLAQGPTGILLKIGSRGAYVAAGGMEEQLDAIPVNAIDTTAAGDAFNGAFAVGLMLGKTVRESARFATAAAALSVTRSGAQPSMPTLQEVEQMLAKTAAESGKLIL